MSSDNGTHLASRFQDYFSEETVMERAALALGVIAQSSQHEGARDKAWAIDQAVRALLGEKYEDFIKTYEYGTTDPDEIARIQTIRDEDYNAGDFTAREIKAAEDSWYDWDTGVVS